jgi:hypothetical protein
MHAVGRRAGPLDLFKAHARSLQGNLQGLACVCVCHDAAVLTLPPSDPTHASCDPCGDESLDACVHASLLFSLESNCFGQAHVMYHVYEIKNIISSSIYFTEAANQGRPRNVNNRRKKQAASSGRQIILYLYSTQINYRFPTTQSINYSTNFQSDHESD